MSMTMKKWLGAAAVGVMTSASAQAALVSSSGTWGSVTPDGFASLSGVGTSILSWGVPSADVGSPGPSQYIFDGVTDLEVMLPGAGGMISFQIGEFTHVNNPIDPPSIEGAVLSLSVTISDLGSSFSDAFDFSFEHDETPNREPCDPAGATVCPDVVRISEGGEESFLLNDLLYTLGLSFGEEGETEFLTEEGQVNTAPLFARLSARRVPEPLSVALVGAGLLGFGLRRRAKR